MRRPVRLACVIATLLAIGASAQARQLAVAYRADDPGARTRVEAQLPAGWPRFAPGILFDDGEIAVIASERLSQTQSADLFAVARRMKAIRGVLATGELYAAPSGRAWIYSGLVQVRLASQADTTIVEPWAATHGMTAASTDSEHLIMLLDAPLSAAALLQILPSVPVPAGPAVPVVHQLGQYPPLTEQEIGGYHRVPRDEHRLAVVQQPGVAAGEFANVLRNAGFTTVDFSDDDPDDDVDFAAFDDADEMVDALLELQDHPTVVRFVGPALSMDPPRFITAELIVDFREPVERDAAQPILDLYGLVEVRVIPYLDHGYLFQRVIDGRVLPGFEQYDAARRLLDARHAKLAVPNIITENVSLCSGLPCPSGSEMEKYLDPIRVGGAWEIAAHYSRDAVIGLLDDGFDNASPQCDQLNVSSMLDSKYCDPGSTSCSLTDNPLCIPRIPESWCDDCNNPRDMSNSQHSLTLGLIAAAIDDTVSTVCDDVVGVAPGARIIDVSQHSLSSSWDTASAIWWMAGGDPKYPDYYPHPLRRNRATVINLSFARQFGADDCPGSPPESICEAICGVGEICSLIGRALERVHDGGGVVRDGGVLVNVGVPHAGMTSDFPSSSHTTAVATVSEDGTARPFATSTSAFYIDPSPDVDLVAPLGGDAAIDVSGSLKGGHTSAATAVVSGVAALMFDVNPDLTAAQADCILKATAQRFPDDLWPPDALADWDCSFLSEHSRCFGYGMVDACEAVEAARACRPCTVPVLVIDYRTGDIVEVEERPCGEFFGSMVFETGAGPVFPEIPSESGFCPCDDVGNRLPDLPVIIDGATTLCLNCAGEAMKGPIADPQLDKIFALIHCIDRGTCLCRPNDPECVTIEVLNEHLNDYEDIHFELCRDKDCLPIPLPDPERWRAGETIRAIVPHDAELVEFWGAADQPKLELRIFAGKERIYF